MEHKKVLINGKSYYQEHVFKVVELLDVKEISLAKKKADFLIRNENRKKKIEKRQAEESARIESENINKREIDLEIAHKKRKMYFSMMIVFSLIGSIGISIAGFVLAGQEETNTGPYPFDMMIPLIMFVIMIVTAIPFFIFLYKFIKSKEIINNIKYRDVSPSLEKTFTIDDVGFIPILKENEIMPPLEALKELLKNDVNVIPTVNQCIYASKVRYVKSRIYEKEQRHITAKANYEKSHRVQASFSIIDSMTGTQFEEFCANLLKKIGYINVKLTKATGDQGVDILAEKNGVKIAVQCKRYDEPLSNSPVQEVYAGCKFYDADRAIVMTNSTFSKGAKELAEKSNVILCDRTELSHMIKRVNDEARKAQAYEKDLYFNKDEIKRNAISEFDRKTQEEKDDYFFDSKIFVIDSSRNTVEKLENYCIKFVGSYIF